MSPSHASSLFYVYRYKGGEGPYFFGTFDHQEKAIEHARGARSAPWTRVVVRDVRAGVLVWDSDDPTTSTRPLPVESE